MRKNRRWNTKLLQPRSLSDSGKIITAEKILQCTHPYLSTSDIPGRRNSYLPTNPEILPTINAFYFLYVESNFYIEISSGSHTTSIMPLAQYPLEMYFKVIVFILVVYPIEIVASLRKLYVTLALSKWNHDHQLKLENI